MRLLLGLLASGAFLTLVASSASAVPVPVIFTFDTIAVTSEGASVTSLLAPNPVVGSGTIDFDAPSGLSGSVSLPDYDVDLDVNSGAPDGVDATTTTTTTTGYTQTFVSMDAAGNVVSNGAGRTSCTVAGAFGGFVCADVNPAIDGWPPAQANVAPGSAAAIHDPVARTFTLSSVNATSGNTTTSVFGYTVVPEPGTLLLMGGGLLGLAGFGRGRRA